MPAIYALTAVLIGLLAVAAPPPARPPVQEPAAARDYSAEPFVIEEFTMRVRYAADGTARSERAMRVRVHSDAGVQALGQLVFGYNSANEGLRVDYVRVRKSDGSVVAAAADNIQDLTLPVAREAPIYTDYRQKHVTVPGLRPGETLEYLVTSEMHTPLAPGHFWMQHQFGFGDQVIVLEETLEVRVPAGQWLQLKTRPGFEPEAGEEDGERVYRWRYANLERRGSGEEDDDHGAGEEEEKDAPPDVELTTFRSWEEVGRWYAELERERIRPNDEIRARAAALTRGLASEEEKIRALYDYVAQNYRYVSLSFGVGRYQPHSAAEVFASQYGDCKDKHTLLAALLEAAGLRAYAALIPSQRKLNPELPSPAQFDHLISVIPRGDALLWADTTTEVAPLGMLTASLRDKQALVIFGEGHPGGPARLVTTPADPPFPSFQHVEVEGEVSDLGRLTARVRYTMRGDTELLLRGAFRRTPQPQWKQIGQILATSDGIGGEVSEVTISDLAATGEPFRVEFLVNRPNFLNWSSKRAELSPPLPGIGMPGASAEAADKPGAEPLRLGSPLEVHVQMRIQVPARYTVRAPVAVGVARDYAEYRSRYAIEGRTLIAERRLHFRLRQLPAARTRDYLAFTRAVRADERQGFALESTEAAGAAAVPESARPAELFEAAAAALRSGDPRTAIPLLERLTEREPGHRRAWLFLGSAYASVRNFAGAAGAFRRQIENNPFDENAYNALGSVLWEMEKFDEAAEAFQKQIEIHPLDRLAHAQLGTMYRQQRKYAEAVEPLERAVALSPDDANLHVNLGQVYLNLGRDAEALASFDKAVELSPSPMVWNNVAYELSLHSLHLDRAERYAESAVATVTATLRNLSLGRVTMNEMNLVSSLAAYWDTLGWIHFQRGDLDAAEPLIRASWLLDLHGEVGDHLAQIYERRGQRELAIRTYAQAAVATRPLPETRGRLAALAGEDKVEEHLRRAREEIGGLRSVVLGKLVDQSAEADFLVLMAPDAEGNAVVEGVRFLGGDEILRPHAAALRAAPVPGAFPGPGPVKLARRGTLSCGRDAGCTFVLLTPDSVTSVD